MAHTFMADTDPALMKQVFNVAKREWKSNIQHDRQSDDFRRRVEVAKWILRHAVETKVGAGRSQANLV